MTYISHLRIPENQLLYHAFDPFLFIQNDFFTTNISWYHFICHCHYCATEIKIMISTSSAQWSFYWRYSCHFIFIIYSKSRNCILWFILLKYKRYQQLCKNIKSLFFVSADNFYSCPKYHLSIWYTQ